MITSLIKCFKVAAGKSFNNTENRSASGCLRAPGPLTRAIATSRGFPAELGNIPQRMFPSFAGKPQEDAMDDSELFRKALRVSELYWKAPRSCDSYQGSALDPLGTL